jgi:hypothetical protein
VSSVGPRCPGLHSGKQERGDAPPNSSCCHPGNELESNGGYSSGSGGCPLKPTAFHSAGVFDIIGIRTICGILLVCALALIPANTFAQRGAAGAHAGGSRSGGGVRAPQAPVFRAPAPVTSHPTAPSPAITRPIVTRPVGVGLNPVTAFRRPIMPVRPPITTAGIVFPTRPPLRSPITPVGTVVGLPGLFGLGYSPFFFWGCNPFWGFAYGCGIGATPGFGYGGYTPPTAYPSEPTYPSDPVYSPSEPSATLQYTPPTNQYPLLESLPAENLSAGVGARVRNEILIYLKDGSVFAVASYTVSDGQLHYLTDYGDKNDLSVDLLDLQRTVEMNAQRGVAFTLTPAADSAHGASAPAPLGPAPAPPGPITPAKP